MKFSCEQCSAQYMIADEKVGQRGVKVKCKKCGNIIVVKPMAQATAPEVATAPAVASVPLGASAPAIESASGAGMFQSPPASVEPNSASDAFPSFASSAFGSASAPAAAAPEPTSAPAAAAGAQMSTAFDSLFGGAGFGGGGMSPALSPSPSSTGGIDFSGLAAAAGAALPSATVEAALQKEWYVAIDDSQIGPIDLREVEQRWDGRELSEDSLAWKNGMADWLPIADIAELSYLVTEHPQKTAASALTLGPSIAMGGDGASAKAPSALGPVSFGTGDAQQISWKPSAASALSSLVQEELVAKKKEEAPAEPAMPAGLPAGLAALGGAKDLFGQGASFASAGFAAPAPAFPGAANYSSGGYSSVPSRRSGGVGGLAIALIVGGGALLLAVVGLVVVLVLRQPVGAPVATTGQAGAPAAIQPVAPVGAAAPQAGAPATGAVPTTAAPVTAAPSERPRPRAEPVHETRTEARAEPRAERPHRDAEEGGGGGAGKAKLNMQDVIGGVRTNAASLSGCLGRARSSGELVPAPYKFILDFMINADGSVAQGTLKGPGNVLGTSLPACFAGAMRHWTFPASHEGTPVHNYPLQVTIR